MADEAVNSPSHYNQTELECIDAIKYALGDEGFVAYCKGNAEGCVVLPHGLRGRPP
jgi:hypothetical protein